MTKLIEDNAVRCSLITDLWLGQLISSFAGSPGYGNDLRQ